MSAKSMWRRAILPASASVQDAIENLDEQAIQIVLIANEHGELIGTLSDGDIRRGLLKGMEMGSSVMGVVNRSPMVVPQNVEDDMVMQIMKANKIRQVPVVDERNVIVGLHLWDRISAVSAVPNTMIIMAGGKGTRLRPFTENRPKPMLHVAGKPMLEHILLNGIAEGFNSFIISLGYLGHMIESYFGDGRKLGVDISYIEETEPLGTAGALSLIEQSFELPFVVTNGDVLTNIQYGQLLAFHSQNQAAATMAVCSHEWQNPYGVVKLDGINIAGFEEKPVVSSHINAGVYALSNEALMYLPKAKYCDMPTLFETLQQAGKRAVAYPMHESWIDVGRPRDLEKANEDSLRQAA